MSYASVDDVVKRFRTLTEDEKKLCEVLLEDAAVLIDRYNANASSDAKKVVSCEIVKRMIGDGSTSAFPVGTTQGTMTALSYSQSFTFGNGSSGELYLTKAEKAILGVGNRVGMHSPLEDLTDD